MPKGIKGFQKGHKLFPGGKLFGQGQTTHIQLKGEKHQCWKGGRAAANRRWLEKHREKARLTVIRRRARKRNAEGSFTVGEWELLKKQYGYTCPACMKKEPEIKLTVDHIIALVKGGSNYIENIQPLCRKCNSKKSSKTIKYDILEY